MYKQNKYTNTSIELNQSIEGETIEQKIERVTTNKEPIKDGAPLIYTDRKDGVLAGHNIKTDRFEIALDAIDKIQKSQTAKSEAKATMNIVRDSGAETIQGTDNGTN
jgi:hypothetical protein